MTSTNPTLSTVLSELPEDLQAGQPPALDLSGLLAAASERRLPLGRMSRFWTLGTLQGKVAAAYAFWWLRGMWSGAERREQQLNETHLRAAVQLLGTMSHLRGSVMKLGQILAHWPGVAPEDFADVLGRLHFQAPPMHFSLLREAVRAELGADPEELFSHFDTAACAAASLGQVHRATLKGSGAAVAVKVQYPGIARTIAADMANLRLLVSPMRMGADGESLHAQLRDVEEMLELEVDYAAEADNLRLAARTLAGLEGVAVPRVHDPLSTTRVLTMEWLDGCHVAEWSAAGPTQAERDRLGERLSRAFMRLCYRANLLHSDLHPGNFLFMPDGRLGLIDLGCMRRYTPEEVGYLAEAEQAAFVSREAVRQVIVRGADLTPRQRDDRERVDTLVSWYDWLCEPTMTEEIFDFSDERYLQRGMAIWRECVRRRYVRNLPINVWIAKSFIGLRAMLFRMGARVALGRILREETCVTLPAAANQPDRAAAPRPQDPPGPRP